MPNTPKILPESVDTSPLTLEKLSDHELSIILSIEHQLQMKRPAASNPGSSKKPYLAPVQVRSPNVLLLDGARGTGKTSLLLTMAHRWNSDSNCDVAPHDYDPEKYRTRICQLQDLQFPRPVTLPRRLHPLRILDFDPIPPQMPLIAGIVHAWEPLAEQYDELAGVHTDCDAEHPTLKDRWERLFRVAAVGWSPVPAAKGLLEQVLDRQEQVHEWQCLGQRWHEFVTEVTERGVRLPERHRLDREPMFVIMIDDVDLQVERISELLPALRLLYHPHVAFLVAADWDHLVDTLKIDFLGRQNRISLREIERNALVEANQDKWAGTLALSAVTKVFPRKNKWTLRRLTLRELLAFPGSVGDSTVSGRTDESAPLTMQLMLNGWPQSPDEKQPKSKKLGDYLSELSGPPVERHETPPFITYRDAHQIFERASMQNDSAEQAIEAVRLLISDPWEEAVRIPLTGKLTPSVEYRGTAELTAHFGPGYPQPTLASWDIMLSSRHAFILRKTLNADGLNTQEHNANETDRIRAMLAVSIQEGGYGVATPGLGWDIRLALVWTRATLSEANGPLRLFFHWRFHVHPDPFELIQWSHEWREFVLDIQSSPEHRLERIAYAWIFYQAKWLEGTMRDVQEPTKLTTVSDHDWCSLLKVVPPPRENREGKQTKPQDWQTQTLPLLARPEIGLPQEIQKKLLSHIGEGDSPEKRREPFEWLRSQRRRLITDAIVAAEEEEEEEGRRTQDAENPKRVECIVNMLESQHHKTHGDCSPWSTVVENNSG